MKISVWITSYNQKIFLKEAIESVLAQTLKPFQVIIVDDCSSDGSRELISSYANAHPSLITPIFHEQNRGVAQVRISALEKVIGDFVTYVDGDDLYLPGKLETEAGLIKKGDFQIAFSNNLYFRDSADNIEHIWAYNKKELPPNGNMYFETLSRSFPRSSLFRMELVNYNAWKQIGFHDPKLKIFEDFDMRIRLTKTMRLNYTLEPFTKIRLGDTGLSNSAKEVQMECLEYIFRKHLHEIESFPPEQSRIIKKKFDSMLNGKLGIIAKPDSYENHGIIQKLKSQAGKFLKRK
jgi:glycosyltransferase involved in cell wall biosynthesis